MPVVPSPIVDWLMEGDPMIRWQTMRDLLDLPEKEWLEERQKTCTQGWGAQTLGLQDEEGNWTHARWTGNVWTLQLLLTCGLPARVPQCKTAASRGLSKLLREDESVPASELLNRTDMCHLGFWLGIGSHFLNDDPRLKQIALSLIELQMPDGGWNCRIRNYPQTSHGSFHTTFNVLEGLKVACDNRQLDAEVFRVSEARALEFMLQHRLFKSDKTGEIVSRRFMDLTFPSYWHYNVLRGLDYFASTPEVRDPRLMDALDYLKGRQKADESWAVEKRIPGVTFFDMEPMGKSSRWNTLRALRVLRAV